MFPITRSAPATVVVEMETKEYVRTREEGIQYTFRSVNGTVPGPMVRGMTVVPGQQSPLVT